MNDTPFFSPGKIVGLVAGGFAFLFMLFGFGQLVETNQAGFVKILQVPISGTMKVYAQPGMFFQNFGNVWEYQIAGTYRFSADQTDDSTTSPPVSVRFSDAGVAAISGNVRFDLPASEQGILNIHQKFRSYEHVAESLIKPAVSEALILTASLMTAEESYSGRRAEYAQLAWDQVLNGVYLTEWERTDVIDPVTKERTTGRVVRIKRDADGNPLRKPNPLKEYGITVSQFLLDKDIAYEEGVLEQIKTQRDAMMKTVTARADATKAEQDRITAEAQGRANVMKAQYEAEVEKATAVVNAQREKEVAETNAARELEVAKLAKEAAEQTKQQQILLGQGESERRRLVLAADGALERKLATYEKVQANWADAFAKRQVPTTVFGGGTGGAGSDSDVQALLQLLTVKTAQDLTLDTKTR
jgi:regulator of protease activity HflC (stomatin/prohibitin superfamily)